jgi:serine O-acetyltransferase
LDKARETAYLERAIDLAMAKVEVCFSQTINKYYEKGGQVYFNPFNTCQYTIFLYYLARICGADRQSEPLAERLYYLNRILHAVDIFHAVELPDIFFCDHPVATVLGRAKYANYFFFSQNCTVGSNKDVFPSFGEHVLLMPGVTIIGNSRVGENCVFSANTFVKDQDIPDNSLVFGASPNLVFKDVSRYPIPSYFTFAQA